ncbi:MAG TPA: Gfo/Idh/MocA family oxidoreductase [Acidimicrobiia bacterium]|nr:Gfo/Idh/MocA family oxidoreductase [Acidimicrobiia bacterium]
MTVRVGVIGTGFGARVVAPVFAETDGCEVVEVVTPRDEASVGALCERRDLDLVCVHSPPFLHGAHVRRAIATGHAVLCDKPFGLDAAESRALTAEAETAGVVNLVNFEFRHDPVRQRLRELLDAGAVGRVEHVQWTHISSGSRVPPRPYGWLFQRAKGGGWIGAWGSHAVDAIRWMLGEIVEARAERRVTVAERPDVDGHAQTVDAEDGFTAWLELESGVTVVLDSTFAAAASIAPRLVVTGSGGVLECVADARITLRRADGTRETFDRPESEGDPHLVPMHRWAEVVRDAVRTGIPVSPNFADGWACDVVLDALRSGPRRPTPPA